MCITESLCCTLETNTILQINYTSIKKKAGIQEVKEVKMFYQFGYLSTILLRKARISPKSKLRN